MRFGEMIRILRIGRRGGDCYISARELAKKLDWSPVRISGIERGLEIPAEEEVRKIGEALGLDIQAIKELIECAKEDEPGPEKPHEGYILWRHGNRSFVETLSWSEKLLEVY